MVDRSAYKLTREAIKQLQKSKTARKLRDSFLTLLASRMVFWIVYWFDYSRQRNAEELTDTVVQLYLNGFNVFCE